MWNNLPASLVILIFSHLEDRISRLQASAVCSRWRDIVLNSSNVILKQHQCVQFICGRRGQCMANDDIRMMIKFSAHIRTVSFKWCVCKTERLLQCLDQMLEVKYFPVKHIRIQGNLSMCPQMCDSDALSQPNQDVVERKVALFSSLLKRCKSLEYLHFGFEQDLSQNLNIMESVMDIIVGGKLYALSIAAIQRSKGIHYSLCEKLNCLNRLSSVCLNWDKYFIDFINLLSSDPNHETRLKQIVAVVSPLHCTYNNVVKEEQWAKLSEYQPSLKLKLVYVDRANNISEVSSYYNIVVENMPLQAIAVVSDSLYLHFPIECNSTTRDKLEEISYHYVETRRQMQIAQSDTLYTDYYELFDALEVIELCGIFIEDSTVIEIGTHFGSRLKDLIIYEMDVVHRSEVTGLLLPLSRAKVYGVERAVSAALGRCWTLQKRRHNHRSIGGNILSKIESVLRDVCD